MTVQANRWNAATIFYILASASLGTYILWAGSDILIPIIFAGLVWFALVSIARLIQQIAGGFAHLLLWLPGRIWAANLYTRRTPPQVQAWFDGSFAHHLLASLSHILSWVILICTLPCVV